AVAIQDRQGVVAPAALRGRLVHLQLVLVLEDVKRADPVVYQAVERREQRRAARKGPVGVSVQVRRVDAPLALDALDLGGLADGLADDAGLHIRLRAGGAG